MRVFCEGIDDKFFIIGLLKHLEVNGELNAKPEYGKYVYPKGCKSKLLDIHNYKKESKLVGKSIKKVLFIFDADFPENNHKDGGLEKSKITIKKLIQDLNWNIKTDYYIFDKNLDDFIMKTIEKKACFEEFEKCLEIEAKNKNKKISTCIYKKLYPNSPYDFSHQNFNELKTKLTNLFQ
jgi:hypothetical protein